MITSQQAKSARLELGVSQNKIAKDTGLSRPYLSNFELGKYEPNNEFKETLKAYYAKEGVVFKDKAEKPKPTKENKPNEKPITPKPDTNTKLVRGILVDINTISLNKAKEYADEADLLVDDLIELQGKNLPIKNGIIFKSIDGELLRKTVDTTIYDMAKAYLKILTIQGNNPLSVKVKGLPKIDSLTNDEADKYSVGDYITNALFSDGNSTDDEDTGLLL